MIIFDGSDKKQHAKDENAGHPGSNQKLLIPDNEDRRSDNEQPDEQERSSD